MTANPDVGQPPAALLACRQPCASAGQAQFALVEQTLRQNRSQLMRLPQVHCAQSYLGLPPSTLLRKESGLDTSPPRTASWIGESAQAG